MRVQSLPEARDVQIRATASTARSASMAMIVILSIWLGAVAYFIAIVAPAAFRVLPTRTLAGALVGQTLPAIFISGIVAGLLVAAFALRGGPTMPRRRAHLWGGAVIALLGVVAQFVISQRIDRLLTAMGTAPDALAPGNPMRVEFGRLHVLAVLCLGVAAVVALVLLIMSLVSRDRDHARRG